MKTKHLTTFLLLIVISFNVFSQNRLYITEDGAGLKDGSSWENAFDASSVQTAINNVNLPGEIWIAQGTYIIQAALQMRNNVAVYGGFQGAETTIGQRVVGKYPTTIQGTGTFQYVMNNTVDLDDSAILDGCILRKSTYAVIHTVGGVFNNCKFCYARSYGIYVSTGTFTNCEIYDIYGVAGIGIATGKGYFENIKISGCKYSGISSPQGSYINCDINNNYEGVVGGTATFINCNISNNTENGVRNSENTFVNCIIESNDVGITESAGEFINCNILNNVTYGINVSKTCSVTNSIIWGNGKQIQYTASGTTFSYCAIEGGYSYSDGDGGNNIGLASENEAIDGPNFLNYNNDWVLQNNSPCLDFGDNSQNTESYDFLDNERIYNETIDIGAIEYTPQNMNDLISLSIDTLNIKGDLGSFQTFSIQTENSWSLIINDDWIQVDKIEGTATNTVTVTADENVGVIRETEIYVNATHAFTKKIIVIQSPGVKTVTVSAGELSTVLTEDEKDNITSIVINGTIDARDFKTMRDEMPNLSTIDLSNANIVSYSGTEGTASTTYYPENTVPENAFKKGTIFTENPILESIILPSSIVEIGESAFSRCVNLTNTEIPEGVTLIRGSAFSHCESILSVTIPSSIVEIEAAAFTGCTNLVSVDFQTDQITDLNAGLFQNCTSLTTINLPFSINYMDGTVFESCTSLVSIVIPPLVDWITGGCFQNCTSLETISLPSSLTGVSNGAFENCISLTSISLPDDVYLIGSYAFKNCTALTTFNIPEAVYDIRSSAFEGCENLKAIYVNRVTPVDLSSQTDVFLYVNKTNCILYVPEGTKTAYETANQWQDFLFITESNTIPLEISTNEMLFASSASTSGLTLLSNTSWTITSNVEWIQCNVTSGDGNQTVYIQVTENSGFDRSATLTIEASSGETKEINIIQHGTTLEIAYLDISEDTIYLTNNELNSEEIEVLTNTTWSLTYSVSWILVSPNSSRTGDGYITIYSGKNTSYTRTAEIIIENDGSIERKIIVIQEGELLTNIKNINEDIDYIYPNPCTKEIICKGVLNNKYVITNNLGQVIFQNYAKSNSIDVSSLKKGIYFIHYNGNKYEFLKL